MDKFIIHTFRKYLPYCKQMCVHMTGNKQTVTFIKDYRLAPAYEETIIIKNQGHVNWMLNSENLDVLYTLPLKGHAFFYINDSTTPVLKKLGYMIQHLMINCVAYKPDRTLKSDYQILVDSQTIKRGDRRAFVKK